MLKEDNNPSAECLHAHSASACQQIASSETSKALLNNKSIRQQVEYEVEKPEQSEFDKSTANNLMS
jgi:hypothetical protein